MKRMISLVIVFISVVSMISFSTIYSVRPVSSTTNAGKKTTLYANIESDINDTFLIIPMRWSQWVFPSKYYIPINKGETKKIPIDIIPFESINPGTYTVMINGYSVKTDMMYNGPVILNVEKPYSAKFGKMFITGEFIPLGNVTIKTSISNLGTKTLQNLVIDRYVYKDDIIINKTTEQITINPNDQKEISFEMNIPEGAKGVYKILFTAKQDGKILDKISDSFNVENLAILREYKKPLNIIFTKGEIVRIENLGNIEKEYTYDTEVSNFEKKVLFTNGVIDGNKIKWDVIVKPGETKELYYKISYFPYIILVIILGAVTWFIFFKMKSLRIYKKVVKKDGSLSVLIEIENSTGKELKSVTVEDSIIPIFKILPHRYGPLFKVKKKKDKFKIIWNIPTLKPDEQRILSYDIHEVIGVNGNIEFGPAEITYKINGKTFKVKSNTSFLEMGNKLKVNEK